MAVKCFCHILQLIVNAGLNTLGIQTSALGEIKTATLGSFPNMNTLATIPKDNKEEPNDKPNKENLPDLDTQLANEDDWLCANEDNDIYQSLTGPPDPLPLTSTSTPSTIDLPMPIGSKNTTTPKALNDVQEKVSHLVLY